jgi:hypothetical protein
MIDAITRHAIDAKAPKQERERAGDAGTPASRKLCCVASRPPRPICGTAATASGISGKPSQRCGIARNRLPESGFRVQDCILAAEATPVNRYDDYRQHALECLRLANDTHESSTKAALIDMAQAWIKLAEQAQRNRQLATDPHAPERVPIA